MITANSLKKQLAFRFLAMHQAGKLDSVKKHHLWQSELDKEDFFKKIFG